jgi:Na+/H+ antiporter
MELSLVAIGGVITIVLVSMLSPRIRLAAPLILVVVGVGISLLPGVPPVHVPSAVILAAVLPPLLYASSISLSVVDLRQNVGTITSLAVVLVVLSAVGTGLLLCALFPDLSLASAIALGAVISPTDAVAASSIGRRLGLPPRLLAVLEGESLVNDASALVLLRTAIAAAAGAVSALQILGLLAYSVVLGVGLGVVIGFLTVRLRARVTDPVLTTAISLVVPFVAYIPAEAVGASGVLSVVAAGLVTGHFGATAFSAPARISDRLNWRTIQFLLENGVFLLLGLELKSILIQVHADQLSVPQAIMFGLFATLLLILIRFAVVLTRQAAAQRFSRRRVSPSNSGADASDRNPHEGLGWRDSVVLSWSGMRGVVTVAAAQSLPEGTPYRPQLVLIAFTVALATLLVQGVSLPLVIRSLGIKVRTNEARLQEFAALMDQLEIAGARRLDDPLLRLPGVNGGDFLIPDRAAIDRVRTDSALRSEFAWEHSRALPGESVPQREYSLLRCEVLDAERRALAKARDGGTFAADSIARAEEMLDLEEARLTHQLGGPGLRRRRSGRP